MKSTGTFQYIADTYFLEQLFSNDVKISVAQEGGATSIFDSVKDSFSSLIDFSSTGSIIKSVLKLVEAGALFRYNWMLGAVDVIAQAFGYSLTDMLASIVSPLKGKIESGEQVTPDEVNQAALGVAGGTVAFSEFNFVKTAGALDGLKRLLGGAPSYTRKKFFATFVGWALKTLLLGAGLLVGGKMIAGLLGKKPEKPEAKSEEAQPQTIPTSIIQTTQTPPGLKPSGAGEENYTGKIWYEPIDGDVKNTVLDWAEEIYPELIGYDGIISRLPSFQKVISELNAGFDPRKPRYMAMPAKYRRRIDVVNQFAGDVVKEKSRNQYV
jgi:hypothetical protein